MSGALAAGTSPGTGAGPVVCESVVIFQSFPDHASVNVQVFQSVRTGSVEPVPAMPISPVYQTAMVAVPSLYDWVLVPTGTVREMKVIPAGALPSASRPSLTRKAVEYAWS